MFKVTRIEKDLLEIEMSGKLDVEGMEQALNDLIEKSAGITHGRMLYDVVDYHLPSLAAIKVEFARLPSMFGFLKKFDKAAVLSDKKWLKTISELEGVLYPGLEIKAFDRDQKSQAMEWLST